MFGRVAVREPAICGAIQSISRIAVVALLLSVLCPAVDAQSRRRSGPKVGDRVEVFHMGKMQPGTITGFVPPNMIVVAVDGDTMMGPMPFLPGQVRLLPDPPKERIWKDSSGSFKISATLVAKNSTSVSLKTPDGNTITVPIEKLSKRDQDYVKEQPLPSGGLSSATSPATGLTPGGISTRPGPSLPSGMSGRLSRRARASGVGKQLDTSEYDALPMGDVSSAQAITWADPAVPWDYTPLAAQSFPPTPLVAVPLPAGDFPSRLKNGCVLVSSCDGSAAVVGIDSFMGEGMEIHVADFANSQLLASYELPSKLFRPRDITPGARFLVTASTRGGHPEHVAFWRPANGSLERVGGWRIPGDPQTGGLFDVRFVRLERAVTIDGTGRLTIWTLAGGKGVATCQVDLMVGRAFSSDGSRAAVYADDAIHLLDLLEGKDLAAIAVEGEPPGKIAFSPGGTRLAGISGTKLIVWDLTTGKLAAQVQIQQSSAAKSIDWVDDQFVFVDQYYLYDTETGIAVWRLSKEHFVQAVDIAPAGNSCYFYQDMQQSGLFSFLVPIEQIKARWDAFDKSTLVNLEAGPVDIQMQGLPFSSSQQQELRAGLTRQLEENGFIVRTGAPLTLLLKVEKGEPSKGEVRDFGEGHFTEPDAVVTYTPTYSDLQIMRGQTVLWKEHRINSPIGRFALKENESCQQAADRLSRPTVADFMAVQLPSPGLLLPDAKRFLGGARLTATGMR